MVLGVLLGAGAFLLLAERTGIPYPIPLTSAARRCVPAGRRELRARPGDHPGGVPAAAAVRDRVLLLAAGPAGQRPADRAAGRGPGGGHDGGGRRGVTRAHRRAVVAVGVRARRDRLADRPGGRGGDRGALARAAAAGDDHRGREPHQRRDRPDRLQVRGRRRGIGVVLAGDGDGRLRARAAAGIAIGLGVGWGVAELRKRLDDAPTEITISLITPYLAYLPAEAVGAAACWPPSRPASTSGWRSPELVDAVDAAPVGRVLGDLQFVLNAVLFVARRPAAAVRAGRHLRPVRRSARPRRRARDRHGAGRPRARGRAVRDHPQQVLGGRLVRARRGDHVDGHARRGHAGRRARAAGVPRARPGRSSSRSPWSCSPWSSRA